MSEECPAQLEEVIKNPDPLILGEHLILKKHFGVNNKIAPECVRINETQTRRGFLSLRNDLFIYADNINQFIKEIDFISRQKKHKTKMMLKFNARRERYFIFEVMKSISKDGVFTRKDFIAETERLGYKTAWSNLWKYEKKGKIRRISKGKYAITYQQA